jgi:transposase-like protein
MPRLSNDERNRAVTMLLQGATQQEVATGLGVHQTTVHNTTTTICSKEIKP